MTANRPSLRLGTRASELAMTQSGMIADRLRTECDRYVDSTLAEFESSLTDTLRVVNRDRAALRKGAGAAGYRPQH